MRIVTCKEHRSFVPFESGLSQWVWDLRSWSSHTEEPWALLFSIPFYPSVSKGFWSPVRGQAEGLWPSCRSLTLLPKNPSLANHCLETRVLGGKEMLLFVGSWQPGKRADQCPQAPFGALHPAKSFTGGGGERELQGTDNTFLYQTPFAKLINCLGTLKSSPAWQRDSASAIDACVCENKRS